jgi:hypothetical protein
MEKKFRLHFSVLNTHTGKKEAYRDSIAATPELAIAQAVDYTETNWGPSERSDAGEDRGDTFIWASENEEWIETDKASNVY